MSLYDATVCARTPLLHRKSVLSCLTNSRRFLSRSSKYLASFLGGACPITSWQAPKDPACQVVALWLHGQGGTHLHDERINCKLYHSPRGPPIEVQIVRQQIRMIHFPSCSHQVVHRCRQFMADSDLSRQQAWAAWAFSCP